MEAERRDGAGDDPGTAAEKVLVTRDAAGSQPEGVSLGSSAPHADGNFEDSTGYGSEQAFHDVAAPGGTSDIPPNPHGGIGRVPKASSRDLKAFAAIVAGLTVVIVPLSLYIWHRTQPRRDLERRALSGRTREALARMQV